MGLDPNDLTLFGRVVLAASIILSPIAGLLWWVDRRYATNAEKEQIQRSCTEEWARIREELARARDRSVELDRRLREYEEKVRDRAEAYHRENQGRLDKLAASIESLGNDVSLITGKLNGRHDGK